MERSINTEVTRGQGCDLCPLCCPRSATGSVCSSCPEPWGPALSPPPLPPLPGELVKAPGHGWLQATQPWGCFKVSPPCPGDMGCLGPKPSWSWPSSEYKHRECGLNVPKNGEKLVEAQEAGAWGAEHPSPSSQPLAQPLARLQGKHTRSPRGHGRSWPGTTQPGLTTLSSHKCGNACLELDDPGQESGPQEVSWAKGGC